MIGIELQLMLGVAPTKEASEAAYNLYRAVLGCLDPKRTAADFESVRRELAEFERLLGQTTPETVPS